MNSISGRIAFADKFTDCIPVLSTFKNLGYLYYQKIHEVNRNVGQAIGWKNHLRVCIITKNRYLCGISSIPVLGNVACIAYYISLTLANSIGPTRATQNHELKKWISIQEPIIRKHRIELVALHLSNQTEISNEELWESITLASQQEDVELFKLIFVSNRNGWEPSALMDAMSYGNNLEIIQFIVNNVDFSGHMKIIEDILNLKAMNGYDEIAQFLQQKYEL